MESDRRRFLRIVASAAALPAVSRLALAQAYPTRPLTMIVPFAAGGPTDASARLLAQGMAGPLGQPIIIENVGAADGTIGVGRVARARPDGYTVDMGGITTHVLTGALYQLPYDLLNDFQSITPATATSFLLYARKTMPAQDLKGLVAWMATTREDISMGVSSAGYRVLTALLQKQTGAKFTIVPYRGQAPQIQDLVSGQIDLCFGTPDQLSFARAGSVKVYAAASQKRVALLPEIPTFAEVGLPEVSFDLWWGLFAPKGTPRDIVQKLNAAAMQALADPTIRSRLGELGFDVFPREEQTPEKLAALVRADSAKWWPLIREFGITAE